MKHTRENTQVKALKESLTTLQENLVAEHTFGKHIDLLEQNNIDWRDPENWGYITTGSPKGGISWDAAENALAFKGAGANRYLRLNMPMKIDHDKLYLFKCQFKKAPRKGSGGQLYMGGYGADSNGNKYTQNYDYSILSNSISVGLEDNVWHTISAMRTGEGNYTDGNAGKPIHNKTCGWKANTLCDTFWFGGLFNYGGHADDITWIKDIEIYEITDNMNCDLLGGHQHNAVVNLTQYPESPASHSLKSSNGNWGDYKPVDEGYRETDTPHGHRTVAYCQFVTEGGTSGGIRVQGGGY